jgi:hypothetical protein
MIKIHRKQFEEPIHSGEWSSRHFAPARATYRARDATIFCFLYPSHGRLTFTCTLGFFFSPGRVWGGVESHNLDMLVMKLGLQV